VVLEPVLLTGLTDPLYVTHARDGSGRLFVVERAGRVKVLPPGAASPTVFLDIRERVLSGDERGLLGLTFHPGYPVNGRFFVNYTRRPDGATVIAEYHVSPADPNAASPVEGTLLVVPQPFANHNGGMVEFGPDGLLYVGMGDGGSGQDPGNRAQNPAERLGKILRLDVDAAGGVPVTVFASGFRNPWRFSFDRASGALYAGDVGENAREEIDIVVFGGNYGWRVFEGTQCTGLDPQRCGETGFIAPVAEYIHAAGRCSVTGGYVYRGPAATLPSGAYVFGDFCSGEIFLLDGGAVSVLLATSLAISSFGEDQAGELYVVGLGGTVHRLVAEAPPSMSLALSQSVVHAGDALRVTLDVHNGEIPAPADGYVGIVHPDGDTVTFLTSETAPSGSATSLAADPRTFPAFAPGVVVPAHLDVTLTDLVTLAFTDAEPPGTYVVFAALVRPGRLADGRVDPDDILAVAQSTVVVSP
jgi:glucose/arabinose dehydrogenase